MKSNSVAGRRPTDHAGAGSATDSLSLAEMQAAIQAVSFTAREHDEDGPRIYILPGALGGTFQFTRERAEKRLCDRFPELTDAEVRRGVRYLESRLKEHLTPEKSAEEPKWMDWRHEPDKLFPNY